MSFLEKFRGKTQLMGKEGVSSLIHESSKPIPKSNSKRNFSSQSEKLKPIFATNEFLSAKKKYENYSDKKPPVFATNEFIKRDKPDDTQSEQISTKPLFSHKKLSLKPEKQKIPVLMKRKDFISIDRGIKENKYNSNKKKVCENVRKNKLPEINKKNYNKEKSIQNGENKFHMINEEVEEDFEELEKRHLEFLNEIEKIKFK